MRIELEFAELHTALFLGGKNHGLKLHNVRPGDPELIYDRAEKELWISHNNKVAIIPLSNVVSMTPTIESLKPQPEAQEPVVQTVKTAKFQKTISAQVSTPTSHVFRGEGGGEK